MKGKLASVIVFFAILFIFPIVTLALPKKEKSENENRILQKMPVLSASTVADRSFMNQFEKYFSDHFVAREQWVQGKTAMELASGKKESNGVFICKNQLIENIAQPNLKYTKQNIQAIVDFAEKYQKKPYFMLVPTAAEIQKNKLPANSPVFNQGKYITDVYEQLQDKTANLDVYSALQAVADEYIYYRTDHHWTSKGAFYAYFATAKAMGYTPMREDEFIIEHVSHNFLGTLFSKTLYEHVTPDIIDVYKPAKKQQDIQLQIEENGGWTRHTGLYYPERLNQKDKYSYFLGENKGIVKIQNLASSNYVNPKRLLLFKDSFAHSMVPFLINHFDEIVMVDLRYINKELNSFINVQQYDQILFLYNIDTFASQNDVAKLSAIG